MGMGISKGTVAKLGEYHIDSRIIDDVMVGSDDNPGTSEEPLATISEAVRRINKENRWMK